MACFNWSDHQYVKLRRRDIVFFKFILESYDNLGYMTVVDKYEAVLKVSFSPGQRKEMENFLSGISQEIDLEILPIPIQVKEHRA